MKEIRTLRADEIECRVQSVKKNGCVILVYKDARVDMKILDEVCGPENWQRTHEVINGNLFCNVEIWCEEKKCWVKKQDVGIESYTEKQKGEASDSFKRACFNVGIGRELYTAPFTWIPLAEHEVETYKDAKGKDAFKLKYGISFKVKEIGYNDKKEIVKLTIEDNKGVERFKYNENANKDLKPKDVKNTLINEMDLAIENKLKECKTLEELKATFTALNPEYQSKMTKLTNTLKVKLS